MAMVPVKPSGWPEYRVCELKIQLEERLTQMVAYYHGILHLVFFFNCSNLEVIHTGAYRGVSVFMPAV